LESTRPGLNRNSGENLSAIRKNVLKVTAAGLPVDAFYPFGRPFNSSPSTQLATDQGNGTSRIVKMAEEQIEMERNITRAHSRLDHRYPGFQGVRTKELLASKSAEIRPLHWSNRRNKLSLGGCQGG